MAKKPGQHTIYFKDHHVDYFDRNPLVKVQRFTQYAVDNMIEEEEMKRKGYVKKFVREGDGQ